MSSLQTVTVKDQPVTTFFDARDVAYLLGVSKKALDRLFRNGVLEGERRGSTWRTGAQALNDFLLHDEHSPKLAMKRKQVRMELKLA